MSNVNYLAQFAKSFNWAGFFLPKSVYQDCSKLYAFCRVLDDLVDEKTDLELREERFNEIKNIYKKTYEIDNNDRNVFGMMPHPERASDSELTNQDGKLLFKSILNEVLA